MSVNSCTIYDEEPLSSDQVPLLNKKRPQLAVLERGSKLLAQWKVTTGDRKTLAGIADIVLVVPYEGYLVWDKESDEL